VKLPNWTIIFHDFSTFSSDEGGPDQAPGKGVLAIVIKDETVGYRVMHGGGPHFGHGFYWWEQDRWFVGDQRGVIQYLNEPGWKVVRLGRTVLKSEWDAMWKQIEMDFGPKSSYWPYEPRKENA
jgi:hypothetical protein